MADQCQQMQLAAVRLECLKLAHRHDRSPEQVEQLADKYLGWVMKTDDKERKPKGK